jgi:hypothetical protein
LLDRELALARRAVDRIELGDPRDGFGGERRLGLERLIEFAAHVRPAGDVHDPRGIERGFVDAVAVVVQRALEVGEHARG